jgi:hypothetical protein
VIASPPVQTASSDLDACIESDARVAMSAPREQSKSENTVVDLARIGWMAVVLACVITIVILLLSGYYGYASVTFAVAASAAINLRK